MGPICVPGVDNYISALIRRLHVYMYPWSRVTHQFGFLDVDLLMISTADFPSTGPNQYSVQWVEIKLDKIVKRRREGLDASLCLSVAHMEMKWLLFITEINSLVT